MSAFSTYQANKFVIMLSKPFTKWPEYKDGIIDENGNIIIKDSNKKQMDVFTNLVRKIKRVLELFIGKNRAVETFISMMLINESIYSNEHENELLNELLGSCISTNIELDYIKEMRKVFLRYGAKIFKEQIEEISQKPFSELLDNTNGSYEINTSVKFDLQKVSKYISVDVLGGFDYGVIIKRQSHSYVLKTK